MKPKDVTKCWSFGDDEQPPYPTIKINLSSAEHRTTIRPKVDTGFNGSLAIDNEAVKKLHLAAKGTILIRIATGHSEAPIYAVNLHQPELGIDYTTLAIGAQRSLVGRTLLKDIEWLLDFRNRRFCLITAPP